MIYMMDKIRRVGIIYSFNTKGMLIICLNYDF